MISSRVAPRLSAPRACSATSPARSEAAAAAMTISSRNLHVEMRPVPDRAEAIFMDGAGMGRADLVELLPAPQPFLAECLVANFLAARSPIVTHRLLFLCEVAVKVY